jgi:hypothetical protein
MGNIVPGRHRAKTGGNNDTCLDHVSIAFCGPLGGEAHNIYEHDYFQEQMLWRVCGIVPFGYSSQALTKGIGSCY